MLTRPTHDRLLALGLTGIAKALEEQRRSPILTRWQSLLGGAMHSAPVSWLFAGYLVEAVSKLEPIKQMICARSIRRCRQQTA